MSNKKNYPFNLSRGFLGDYNGDVNICSTVMKFTIVVLLLSISIHFVYGDNRKEDDRITDLPGLNQKIHFKQYAGKKSD